MVKKIKKYLKFVVCCALIMSLVAPSYAALSASDGSAFVTKAEFDAALADFNSRLTTFEAGINSKIDSQVTSYLDRNGIWNGRTQLLLNSDFSFSDQPECALYISEYYPNEANSTFIKGSGYSNGEVAKNSVSESANVLHLSTATHDQLNKSRTVFKADKAGMCVITATHRFFANYDNNNGRNIATGWPKLLGFGGGETSGTWSNFLDETQCAGNASGLMFATNQEYVLSGMISPNFTCNAQWIEEPGNTLMYSTQLLKTGVGSSPYKGQNGLSCSINFKPEKYVLFYFVKKNAQYELNINLACGGKFWENTYMKGGSATNPFFFSFYGVESVSVY